MDNHGILVYYSHDVLIKEKIVWGGLYWSPNGIDIKEFLNFIETIFDSYNIIITGDLNINLLENSANTTRLLLCASSAGFKQIIREPTRCAYNSRILVDNIYTNFGNIQETVCFQK